MVDMKTNINWYGHLFGETLSMLIAMPVLRMINRLIDKRAKGRITTQIFENEKNHD